MIDLFSNTLGEEELEAVGRVFRSRWLGYGSESRAFEKEFGERIGSTRALLTNSCTAALFMSMDILSIGPGDEVIIPTVNFVGCANAIIRSGARPLFADVDPSTLNILPEEITRLRTDRTRAVLLLHYGGHPADMDAIRERARGLRIIEDSANSIVSTYRGQSCGTLGDLGCFSFDSMKILCVGDAGAIVVNDPELLQKAQEYRYMGLAPKASSGIDSFREGNERWWEINLGSVSNRYTSNDIIAAIARVQLRKLDGFIRRRKEVWSYYQQELRPLEWLSTPPEPLPGAEGSYYLYWLRVEDRDRFAKHLVDRGVYCTFRYFPLHMVAHYGYQGRLPNAERVNETAINIPLHQNLTDGDVEQVVQAVRSFKE